MPSEQPDPTLEDALNAAYDEVEAAAEAEPAHEPAPPQEPVEETSEEVSAVEPAAGERRPGAPPADDATPAPALAPPEHWSAEDKAAFDALPEPAREPYMTARRSLERGYDDKFRSLADQRKAYEQTSAVLESLRPELAARGVTPEQAMMQMAGAMAELRRDPVGGLSAFFDAYGRPLAGSAQALDLARRTVRSLGVDVAALLDDAEPQHDPATALTRQIEALGQRFEQLQHQTIQSQQVGAAQRQVEAFAAEKDAAGHLAHPHLERLKPVMAKLVQAGVATDLAAAYEAAAWADPEIRATLAAPRTNGHDPARVAKAKAASAKPRTSPGAGGAPNASAGSWKEALESAYDAVTNR